MCSERIITKWPTYPHLFKCISFKKIPTLKKTCITLYIRTVWSQQNQVIDGLWWGRGGQKCFGSGRHVRSLKGGFSALVSPLSPKVAPCDLTKHLSRTELRHFLGLISEILKLALVRVGRNSI